MYTYIRVYIYICVLGSPARIARTGLRSYITEIYYGRYYSRYLTADILEQTHTYVYIYISQQIYFRKYITAYTYIQHVYMADMLQQIYYSRYIRAIM